MVGRTAKPSRFADIFCLSPELPADIFPGLFDGFIENQIFRAWYEGYEGYESRKNWQLHCIGGPGSGKTTLSALVALKIKDEKGHLGCPVVFISIEEDIVCKDDESQQAFLSTFLRAMVDQLNPPRGGDGSSDSHGSTQSLRQKFLERLPVDRPAFLIVDGIDRCCPDLASQVEAELKGLQSASPLAPPVGSESTSTFPVQGIKIMTTSRFAFEAPIIAFCDIEDKHFESNPELRLFLQCSVCENVMCISCQKQGEQCPICGNNDNLEEPYDERSISVRPDAEMFITKFISWTLEKEHGDIGLGSLHLRKPPLSELGIALREDPHRIHRYLEQIPHRNNPAIVKALLDRLDRLPALVATDGQQHRLPPNLVAIFDAEIARIERQPEKERDLGLKMVTTVGRVQNGIPCVDFMDWVEREYSREGSIPTLEMIVKATRGLLWVTPTEPEEIRPYQEYFFPLYVSENYNEILYWAFTSEQFFRQKFLSGSQREDTKEYLLFDEPEHNKVLPGNRVLMEPSTLSPGFPRRIQRTSTLPVTEMEKKSWSRAHTNLTLLQE